MGVTMKERIRLVEEASREKALERLREADAVYDRPAMFADNWQLFKFLSALLGGCLFLLSVFLTVYALCGGFK